MKFFSKYQTRNSLKRQQMSIPLDVILDDIVSCMGFYDFVQRFHAEENIRFYFAVEVFANRSWKALKLLGIEQSGSSTTSSSSAAASATSSSSSASTNSSGASKLRKSLKASAAKAVGLSSSSNPLPSSSNVSAPSSSGSAPTRKGSLFSRGDSSKGKSEENAIAYQKKLDALAAKQLGVSMEQILLMKEADYIFDTFIRSGAPMWVCLDHRETERIQHELIFNYRTIDRNLFKKAQSIVYDSMNEDLAPRFLREVNGDSKKNGAQMTEEELFLKEHITKLAASRRRKTGMSTAIAFTFGKSTTPTNAASSSASSSSKSQSSSVNDEERIKNLNNKKSNLMTLQKNESVGALPLSRNRLSQRSLASPPSESSSGSNNNLINNPQSPKAPRASGMSVTSPSALSGNSTLSSNRISVSMNHLLPQTSLSSKATSTLETTSEKIGLESGNTTRHEKAMSLPPKAASSASSAVASGSNGGSSKHLLLRQRSLSDPTQTKPHTENRDVISLSSYSSLINRDKSDGGIKPGRQRNGSESAYSMFPLFSSLSVGGSNMKTA